MGGLLDVATPAGADGVVGMQLGVPEQLCPPSLHMPVKEAASAAKVACSRRRDTETVSL